MEGSASSQQVKVQDRQGGGRRRNNYRNRGRQNQNNKNSGAHQDEGGPLEAKSQGHGQANKSHREPKPIQAKLKVLVRNLPPNLTEDTFRKQVDEKFGDEYSWLRFWEGKEAAKGRPSVLSRCYLRFKAEDKVANFCREFQGHAYINDKGVRFLASVQFAPYQRCPRARPKKGGRDLKQNSIRKDADYKRFVAELEKTAGVLRPSAEVQLDQKEAEQKALLASTGVGSGNQPPVAMTPLMTYMKKKANMRVAKRQRQRQRDRDREAAANRKSKEKLHHKQKGKSSKGKNSSSSSRNHSKRKEQGGEGENTKQVKIKARSSHTKTSHNSGSGSGSDHSDPNAWTTVITRKSHHQHKDSQGGGHGKGSSTNTSTNKSASSGSSSSSGGGGSSGKAQQRGQRGSSGSRSSYRKGKGNHKS